MKCIVQQCSVTSGQGKKLYAPSKSMRLKWLTAIDRLDLADNADAIVCVCEQHFPPSSFTMEPKSGATTADRRPAPPRRRILPNAIPYIVLPAVALPVPMALSVADVLPSTDDAEQTGLMPHSNDDSTFVLRGGVASRTRARHEGQVPLRVGVPQPVRMESVIGHQRIRRLLPKPVKKPKRCIPRILNRPQEIVLKETTVNQGLEPRCRRAPTTTTTTSNEVVKPDHLVLLRPNDMFMYRPIRPKTDSVKQVVVQDSRMSSGLQTGDDMQKTVSVTAAMPKMRSVGTQIITKYSDEVQDGEEPYSDDDAISEPQDWRDDPPSKRMRHNSDYTDNSSDIASDISGDIGPKQIVIPPYVNPYSDVDVIGSRNERKFIVFEKALDSLFACLLCNRCGHNVQRTQKTVKGSCLTVNLLCRNGHSVSKWCSQPKAARRPAGNLLLAAAIKHVGTGFTPIKKLADYTGLCFIGRGSYHSIQRDSLFPILKDTWEKKQSRLSGGIVLAEGAVEEDATDHLSISLDPVEGLDCNVDLQVSELDTESGQCCTEDDDADSFEYPPVTVKQEVEDLSDDDVNIGLRQFLIKDQRSTEQAILPSRHDDDHDLETGGTTSTDRNRRVRNGRNVFGHNQQSVTNESFTVEEILCAAVKKELVNYDEDCDLQT